ncbi:MAG: sigma-70 family RNA polymerase sigma factor [Ardenticatenaceae bacterium]|nr:sigma-70 family RNA polymerase sigma factor [Ardenticatenaceae bacterium]
MNKSGEQEQSMVSTASDNALIERISAGDMASFDTLFYRHYDRVYGLLFRLVGNRVEAEDITQEVFLKLYNHAFAKKVFKRNREHNIGAWLYRVATNMGYNHIRGRKRRWTRNVWLVPSPDDVPRPDAEVERLEAKTAVRQALARLPQRQTQLLLLRQMGLSYAECAEACDVAPGSVGTLLARASEAFRKAYQEEIGE